jgi:ATP-dependent Lhr-like helicase
MIHKVKRKGSKGEVLGLMEPLIQEWFNSRFDKLTEPEAYAIPLIHQKKNVLVFSPTGSGKTIAAFLSIINELLKLDEKGELEDRIYCVYISPLKALANDINRNLTTPLEEMKAIADEKNVKAPNIRVAVRSGDTSAYERQKMARKPPHIFITTPESLSIVLSTPKFREKFSGVEYVIVDEIHEVCSSKRGVFLSLSLERLQEQVKKNFVRIGLSATIAPVREISKFLVGYENNRLRDVWVAEAESRKGLDMGVICPVEDIARLPYEIVNAKMYDQLKELVDEHRTTLIFTNTRSGTERISFKLKEKGVKNIAAHHGSLSKFTRLDVEERLKNGDLKAAISSTSLELGIDIGYIDLVCQIGSPKTIAKGMQRIGRAGHAVGETAKGRMLVFDNDDLIECAVLTKNAYENRIDRVDIPNNCLDVLAQSIVGMSLERRWAVDDAFKIIKRSYCYHHLPKKDFMSVINYLSSRDFEGFYSKIWFDPEENIFGRKKGSRLIYYLNLGTIPEEANYRVFSQTGKPLGELSEKFVERLSIGDIFVLGGKTYEFYRRRGMRVFVKDASGRKPTVPSWTGEMLPRSFDLSCEIGKFREEMRKKIDGADEGDVERWLMDVCKVDGGSARSMMNHVKAQMAVVPSLPTRHNMVIEGYVDGMGNHNAIFHCCFGRRVNDALSRAYAFALSSKLKCNIRISVTDNNFMLTAPKKFSLESLHELIKSDELEAMLKRAVRHTELFNQRFRHCATRSFMVLRNYKGKEVSIGRQQLRSSKVLDALSSFKNFPAIKETYNEILNIVMDMNHAKQVLTEIKEGVIKVSYSNFSNIPSPFAHNVVLIGMSDIVLMEDRSTLLKELHRQVLSKVITKEEIEHFGFDVDVIKEYYKDKIPRIEKKKDILSILRKIGALNLFQQKGRNVYDLANVPHEKIKKWCIELLNEGKVASIWMNGPYWVIKEDVDAYAAVYAKKAVIDKTKKRVLNVIDSAGFTKKERCKEVKMDAQELKEVIGELERAFLIHRKGFNSKEEIIWSERKINEIDRDDAVSHILCQYLWFYAPATMTDCSYSLGLEEGLVRAAINDLEGEGIVSSGFFILGEGKQYLLSKDLVRLEGEECDVFDEKRVMRFHLHKQFYKLKGIDDYLDRFGEVGMVYDIFGHVKDFDMNTWKEKRRQGEIIQGRFRRSRVSYIRRRDARTFVSAYRYDELNDFDKEVMDIIEMNEGITLDAIVKRMNIDREKIKNVVDKLDRNMYVIRKFTENEGWISKNRYIALNTEEYDPDCKEKIIRQFLRGYGPVPLVGIRGYTAFSYADIHSILGKLKEEGIVREIVVIGKGEDRRWILNDELKELKEGKLIIKDKLRILSLYDPFVQPLWVEIMARYGNDWIYPVVKNGKICGMVELWQMGGYVEIRDIELDNDLLLEELIEEVAHIMNFYRARGFDVVKINRVFNKEINELDQDILQKFFKNGYNKIQNFLAKGNLIPACFNEEDVLKYVMWKQHLHPENKFQNVMDAVIVLGGLRSNFEGFLRVRDFRSLERYQREGVLLAGKMIPEYFTYCTEEDVCLYKKAKNTFLNEYMKLMLKIVKDKGRVSRNTLFELSPFGYGTTSNALKKLYTGLHILKGKDNKFHAVSDAPLPVKEAREKVLKRILGSFGVFSAENLASFTKGRFKMRELRDTLRSFEKEGFLVKGFLIEEDSSLYWMIKDDVKEIGNIEFERKFVLTPDDRLSIYFAPLIRKKFGLGSCHTIFDGCRMIGAFKARKRRGELVIKKFIGDEKAKSILKDFSIDMDVKISEETKRTEDWEIIRWWEGHHAANRSKAR